MKYSHRGGEVRLGWEPVNGRVRFWVADDGVGIPLAHRERVFEKFYRSGPQTTRAAGGTGLGLYISRELTERMGGQVSLESEAGAGARFVIELPVTGEIGIAAATLIDFHADPADRLITATALLHHATLVTADGSIVARTGKTETGTSASAYYAQVIAEELDVEPSTISMVMGHTDETPDGGVSAGLLIGAANLRKVAAYTRQALLGLAAEMLGAPVASLTVSNGVVRGGGRSVSYADHTSLKSATLLAISGMRHIDRFGTYMKYHMLAQIEKARQLLIANAR